jgi:hypothetical protein
MVDQDFAGRPSVELLDDRTLRLRYRAEGDGIIGDFARIVRVGDPDWARCRPQAVPSLEYEIKHATRA